jgi:exonuclease III
MYVFKHNHAVQQSSGTAIAFHKAIVPNTVIHEHRILVPGSHQTSHIMIQKNSWQIINIYMPQQNELATIVTKTLADYIKNISIERETPLGGDWNVTHADQDRKKFNEQRKVLAKKITEIISENKLVDVWRFFNPNSNQITYKGNQINVPISRKYRFYTTENCMYLVMSANIGPIFADYSSVSLNILPAITKHHSAY